MVGRGNFVGAALGLKSPANADTVKPMATKKSTLLGINHGTANHRLRKALMFHLADQLNLLDCHRCGERIETSKEMSIEHKEPWEGADDPMAAFMDLENIAFSHLRCNVRAASKPWKIYNNRAEKRSAEFRRFYAVPENRLIYSENRKVKRRKA